MTMIFTSPLFALKPDSQPRIYANVQNTLQVARKGKETDKYINLSLGLFTIMRFLKVPTTSQIDLYLDEDGKRMVFGLVVDGNQMYDLWSYTLDRVPPYFLN